MDNLKFIRSLFKLIIGKSILINLLIILNLNIGYGQPANSPWPMFRHDPQHTGRSPYATPEVPNLQWTFSARSWIQSSVAIGADGTLYFGSSDYCLYAIHPDGTLKWSFVTGSFIDASPAIDSQGNIYVGSCDGKLYALKPDGTLNWSFSQGNTPTTPTIGPDGTIYIGSWDYKLYALEPSGVVKWEFLANNKIGCPAVGADGIIYFGSDDGNFYAIFPDNTLKWMTNLGARPIGSSPAISADGIIYVGAYDHQLYAMNSADGKIEWSYPTGGIVLSSPGIGVNGTIYVGSFDSKIYAINPNGTLNWTFDTGDAIWGSSPAIDANGVIYVGSFDNKLYAINPDGTIKWEFSTDDDIFASPAIGDDGTIYIGSKDRKLYAIAKRDSIPEDLSALVLVDTRLYTLLKAEIDSYLNQVQHRRNFKVHLDAEKNLDDYSYSEIQDLIQNYILENPGLEGVLFIGNIKLPSFYKVRGDNRQIRLFPAFFEDFDLNLSRYYLTGSVDPRCDGTNEPYCQVFSNTDYAVPEHDLDDINNFPSEPDIWFSILPVGSAEDNTYQDFANQLKPYFTKLLNFYNSTYMPDDRMYMVSNDMFGGAYNFWELYDDVSKVDFYAMNPDKDTTCICSGRTPEQCYVRVPLEDYASFADFLTEYNSRYWMGEGWQKPEIYLQHMQNNNYEYVIVNVHSNEGHSLISYSDAQNLQNGGMIMMGMGCSVAGFKQPKSPSHVESSYYSFRNILVNYLYGESNFLAALGSPFNRGHAGHFEIIIDNMKNSGDYLGKAHLKRMQYMYAIAGDRIGLKENLNEMLLGDPFLDVKTNTTPVARDSKETANTVIPEKFYISNYPNPFNTVTYIRFGLVKASQVRIDVYTLLGQHVAELLNCYQSAGSHSIRFDASELASGIYLYSIQTEEFSEVNKMILMK